MAELSRSSVRAQLGADDPAASAAGLTVRLLDPAAQFYVTGADVLPNTVQGGEPYLLWLAPDRCLLVAETATPDTAQYGFVSDMTDGLALFEVVGPRAGEIVAMGCTLAPGGPQLVLGHCAQTLFGGVRVVIYRHGTAERFQVHAERQLAAYLLEWFKQAASALV